MFYVRSAIDDLTFHVEPKPRQYKPSYLEEEEEENIDYLFLKDPL
jgi:hypothetical protein